MFIEWLKEKLRIDLLQADVNYVEEKIHDLRRELAKMDERIRDLDADVFKEINELKELKTIENKGKLTKEDIFKDMQIIADYSIEDAINKIKGE